MRERQPSPFGLWEQARDEQLDGGHDDEWWQRRYRELMVKYGMLVPREDGDDGALPCGWKPGDAP